MKPSIRMGWLTMMLMREEEADNEDEADNAGVNEEEADEADNKAVNEE